MPLARYINLPDGRMLAGQPTLACEKQHIRHMARLIRPFTQGNDNIVQRCQQQKEQQQRIQGEMGNVKRSMSYSHDLLRFTSQ
jgi:hypothetical protein